MIQRRGDRGVRLLPKTFPGWVALVLVVISLVTFGIAFRANSDVWPWTSVVTCAAGVVMGIFSAMRLKDVTMILGVLGAIAVSTSVIILLILSSR